MTVRRWQLIFAHPLIIGTWPIFRANQNRSRQERFAAALVQHVLQKYEDWILSHAHDSCVVSHHKNPRISTLMKKKLITVPKFKINEDEATMLYII